ncbi:hypothetical protein CPH39_24750 [Escherichia coli]|uniref:Uncharacterized protein n=1 Tax=Escherichia coli TaxID=562 RepID=A0A8S7CVK4_ECOLX|nr:hypothetical protein [Escherichia coli]EFB2359054.1 hypothetical protein [Escherichia coli]EFC6681157.1 hypothetical protein [Escherichia coli]QHD14649.1 hypothetical protein CPH39_24750 [Escherichia coli]HAH0331225.1 hypothetical protein [Escherichia coli]
MARWNRRNLLARIWQSSRSYIVTGLIHFLPEILPHKLTSKLSPVHCIYIISFELFLLLM